MCIVTILLEVIFHVFSPLQGFIYKIIYCLSVGLCMIYSAIHSFKLFSV